MATTRPPEDKGSLVRIGEAEAGSGFRFTGEGMLLLLRLDLWVWNAGREGMSTEGYPNCFKCGSTGAELVGMAGAMPGPICCGERPRSITFLKLRSRVAAIHGARAPRRSLPGGSLNLVDCGLTDCRRSKRKETGSQLLQIIIILKNDSPYEVYHNGLEKEKAEMTESGYRLPKMKP